jgi:hypothetical protein
MYSNFVAAALSYKYMYLALITKHCNWPIQEYKVCTYNVLSMTLYGEGIEEVLS